MSVTRGRGDEEARWQVAFRKSNETPKPPSCLKWSSGGDGHGCLHRDGGFQVLPRLRKLGNGQAVFPTPTPPHHSLQMLTFDDTGGDDALGRSPITSRDNAGLVQVGPRHHHLLQVLRGEGRKNQAASCLPSRAASCKEPQVTQGTIFVAAGLSMMTTKISPLTAQLPSFRKGPLFSHFPSGLSAPECSTAGLFPGLGLCPQTASEDSQGPKL
ncbi:hypothetical protein E2320_005737 [Naja naja]|nr:hypothetical protein E2320_005737 [Naja naja]